MLVWNHPRFFGCHLSTDASLAATGRKVPLWGFCFEPHQKITQGFSRGHTCLPGSGETSPEIKMT